MEHGIITSHLLFRQQVNKSNDFFFLSIHEPKVEQSATKSQCKNPSSNKSFLFLEFRHSIKRTATKIVISFVKKHDN
jgi:hypothetical protein